MPKSVGIWEDMFPPTQNRCAAKNRDDKVHRGSQGNRAAWQTTNMKEGGSISISLLPSASNPFPVSWPFHFWPASADQSICGRVQTWTQKHSSTASKPDNHFHAYKISTGLLFSKPPWCLCLFRVAECDPTKSNCSPIAPLSTAGISEKVSPFEPLLLFSKSIAETIMRLWVVCIFFLQGQLQWSTSSGKKNYCHQHAVPVSEAFIPVKHNQVFKAGPKNKLSTFAIIGATDNNYSPGGRDRDRGLLSLLILTFVNLLASMQQLLLKHITGMEMELWSIITFWRTSILLCYTLHEHQTKGWSKQLLFSCLIIKGKSAAWESAQHVKSKGIPFLVPRWPSNICSVVYLQFIPVV